MVGSNVTFPEPGLRNAVPRFSLGVGPDENTDGDLDEDWEDDELDEDPEDDLDDEEIEDWGEEDPNEGV